MGVIERFSHKLAIAPTASISIICGGTSPCKEPWLANIFTQKTLSGSFSVKNKFLERLLSKKGLDTDGIWASIIDNHGSVQHLDALNDDEKKVFRTAQEVDQEWIIRHAADSTPYICQSQSVNLFLAPDISKSKLHRLHWMAWEAGLKSLYYVRSQSLARPDKVSHLAGTMPSEAGRPDVLRVDGEICESCQ